MSFFVIYTNNQSLRNKAKNYFEKREKYQSCDTKDLLIFFDRKNENLIDIKKNIFLLYEGSIMFSKNPNDEKNKREFARMISSLEWPLNDNFSGYFAGVLLDNESFHIFNDAVGIFHLYYYLSKDYLIVSTNLSSIYEVISPKLNKAAIVLETVSPFIQYGTMTALDGVKRLLPGELIKINLKNNNIEKKYDYTIKEKDGKPGNNFPEELVDLIENEMGKFYRNHDDEIILSLSGGIDSRVNLMGLINNKIPFKAVHYGKPNTLETKIAQKLAKEFNFSLAIVDPTADLFPEKKVVEDIIKETDSLFLNMWHAIILKNDKDNDKVFLLGDMLDILRAKSIKSFKSRGFRTKFYLKKFLLGARLPLKPYNEENKNLFCENKIDEVKRNVIKQLQYFDFSNEEKESILEQVREDIMTLCSHVENYYFNTTQSFEELFNIFSSGRLNMGKQLNLLRYKFKAEIPLSNIKILRKVLNISPEYRYADELTFKMFKTKKWRKGGKIETNQNPFFSYNSSLSLMLLGWFLRSKADYFFTKLFVLTKGKWQKKRLFNFYDFTEAYQYPKAMENYYSYFESQNKFQADYLKELFERRKTSKAWPLSPMDLMPQVQAAYWLNKEKF